MTEAIKTKQTEDAYEELKDLTEEMFKQERFMRENRLRVDAILQKFYPLLDNISMGKESTGKKEIEETQLGTTEKIENADT